MDAQTESQNMRKLGFGASFERPDREITQMDLRRRILEEVKHSASVVLDELADYPLALYCDVPFCLELDPSCARAPEMGLPFAAVPWFWPELIHEAESNTPGFPELRRQVSCWAQKWFKDEPEWLMDDALCAMHMWRVGLSPASDREWFLPRRFELWINPPRDVYSELTITVPRWHWWRQSEAEWIEEAVQAAKAQLVQHAQDHRTGALQAGLVEVPRRKTSSDWHIKAFILFQVLDQKKADIVKQLGLDVSPDAVDEACRGIAEFAEIDLRTEATGRPLGRRNNRH